LIFIKLKNVIPISKDEIGVNRQLPPKIASFVNYTPEINKISITFCNCTTLINLPPLSNSSVNQHDILQISHDFSYLPYLRLFLCVVFVSFVLALESPLWMTN